jgi:arylsulfatase A-like enzyme
MATAADLSGAQAPANIDSISFLPTLKGEPDQQAEHDYLYWEFYEGSGGAQAVRQGPWKAVRKPGETGPVELYNLEEDLGEEHDVAAEHPDIVSRLVGLMDEAHSPNPNWSFQ